MSKGEGKEGGGRKCDAKGVKGPYGEGRGYLMNRLNKSY